MDRHDENRWLNHGLRPAGQLAGMELPNGWKVEYPSCSPEISTGGTFSVPYIVNSETRGKAFLKAMDYTRSR